MKKKGLVGFSSKINYKFSIGTILCCNVYVYVTLITGLGVFGVFTTCKLGKPSISSYQLLLFFYQMTFFTRSEVGTGWKYWFHFGLKIGFICPGCMAKVLAIAFVGLCLTFSPYSRASFSVFSTCCFVYLATSRSGLDFHL